MTPVERMEKENSIFMDGYRLGLKNAAKLARGETYKGRYRTWSFWPVNETGGRGNVDGTGEIAKHCDKIASLILSSSPQGEG